MIDQIKIHVKAGDGGKGLVGWRHEKFYAYGGPFGGDGGRGGHVYVEVDTNETTLAKLRYTKSVKAGNGEPGKMKKMHGADGEDVTLRVPLGTMIRNAATGDLLADLTRPHQIVQIAHGGKGGLGNYHFATARNDAPEYAQPGEPGESLDLIFELRLLADAGLIGFPSVGKSTFLSAATNARPAIAAYPFTTLEPNIGVVELKDGRSFVLADMPGLIEGAAEGRGLGDTFLRHIRRCRVLIHVLDMSGEQGDPLEDYAIINKELGSYDASLLEKPQILVANKMDMDGAEDYLRMFKEAHPGLKVFETSTQLHKGIEAVLNEAEVQITRAREAEQAALKEQEQVVVYRYEPKRPDFTIENLGNRKWKVVSEKVDRLADTVDFNKENDVFAFAATLTKMGIDKALAEAGARDGDQVIVGSYVMDYNK